MDNCDTSGELLIDFVRNSELNHPDAVALAYDNREWTWTEWHRRIQRLTGVLAANGLGRGDRIAFLDKNHPACLDTVIAASMLGVAVAIINWRQSADELNYILNDSGARLLLIGFEFTDTIAQIRSSLGALERIIVVGGDADEYEVQLATETPPTDVGDTEATDTALIIYSSGTTGRPKGVLLSQRALIEHTRNVGTLFPFEAGDRSLVAMPLFHVGGISYALFGIHAGIQTVISRTPQPDALIATLLTGITHTFLVPPVIAALLDSGASAVAALARLKLLGYGAAPMPEPLLRRALDALPAVDFVQVYGQTEVAGAVSALSPADHRDSTRPHLLLSAGKAVSRSEIRAFGLDNGGPLDTDEQGELWVRTEQRMTGYLNRPTATDETITSDGWVRTGDIGRIDPEGYVFVDDRLKDMIITGGENVYGPEVERVLLEHPHISDAAVIGVPDDHWGEAIKAVIVTTAGIETAEVIAFCRQHLAGYKCPRSVDVVAALPRNPSGKILKRDLRQSFWSTYERSI